MSNIIIQEEVDIYQLPAVDAEHNPTKDTQITIGDLHGNTMKLLFMLVKHGIATNITEEDYQKFVQIYRTPTRNLSKENLQVFNEILATIEFNNGPMIRLIGDELADRGSNDYFTLKVLEKLYERQVPVEILVSNHGIEFIEAYEKQDHFHPPMLDRYAHAPSMENLEFLINQGIVSRDEILSIAEKHYKPALRAISYTLSEDQSEITIYSHAGIGLNTIKSLASKLNVVYQDASALELAETIDNINIYFLEHVQNNTVHTLYDRSVMYQGYESSRIELTTPFEFIMWNRHYDRIDRPAVHSGYKIYFAHGHDSSESTQDNIYNLDNPLGKNDYLSKGPYTVLSSQADEITLSNFASLELSNAKIKFASALKAMREKARELETTALSFYDDELASFSDYNLYSAYKDAALNANTLCDSLQAAAKAFFKDGDKNAFNWAAARAIGVARDSELKNHRGYAKEILAYAGLAVLAILTVATLGLAYIAVGVVNYAINREFFFSTRINTDSINKVDDLENTVGILCSA